MHGLLTDDARRRVPLARFVRLHRADTATATATALRFGEPGDEDGGVVPVPARASTRAFGTLRPPLRLRVDEDGERVAWERHLAFPGVPQGRRLERSTRLPERATLLAADGTVLAEGPARTPEDAALSASIAGTIGPAPRERAAELRALGAPADAAVGLTGLERALDARLMGRPGGTLRGGDRVLARTEPAQAPPVRSTIRPGVQRAAVAALAGRLGGVVALDPDTGRVTAAAGFGLSGLQPPGSTFKVITLAAALEARVARRSDRFPVVTETTLEGVTLENANGEACGGTLTESFAESCNSVFAPLGARLGAERLVAAAERFGFNAPPGIPGAATSTIPPADEIGDDLAVGSTAIGQGRLQASALQLAVVSAVIANRGRRPVPTVDASARPRTAARATPPAVARQVGRMMRAVVTEGTGTGGAIPGVAVAGKTGTAELEATVGPEAEQDDDPTDTTAWFTAFAPLGRPRAAVAVVLPEQGAGGATAAPAAQLVLAAALER